MIEKNNDEVPDSNPDSECVADYTCLHCHRKGTAVLRGSEMKIDVKHGYVPHVAVHCWNCKSQKLEYDEIVGYT